MKNRFLCLLLCIFAFTFCLTSCFEKSNEEVINLDNSDPLALAPDVQWIVVSDPYSTFRKNYDWYSEITSYARKGDIYQILGKSTDSDNNMWILCKEGWISSSCVEIVSNKFKAQTVSSDLLKE